MKCLNIFLSMLLVSQFIVLPACARPGESLSQVLEKFSLTGQEPVNQGEYISYKVSDTKFVSQPTVFFKIGAKGIILEENFLFDKNTVHEKDVQRSKSDIRPAVSIPHHTYLVGDFSQLPREQFDTKSKVVGAIAAPFGLAAGTVAGAGKGLYEGTKIGVKTADSASRALGGDVSGKAGAWASSATAVVTGAVTGLFAGFTGGAVEGSVRGARVAIEGISGADREITDATPVVDSQYVIIGGRIGKELTLNEQKSLLDELSKLEQSRLAGGQDTGTEDLAKLDKGKPVAQEALKAFDSAKEKAPFDVDSNYLPEDAVNKNVAGMW
ncbi:MAG: hypothetical protein HYY52_00370 [Candidatus Melainabacteria bacterium]|nr:hypothetical protein [Candidatus Melainabacteria bacterium]